MNTPSQSNPAQNAPQPLSPIPRDGIPGFPGILLGILLTLACATVGIGLCALTPSVGFMEKPAQILAVVSLVLLTVYLWRVTRTTKVILVALILIGGALFYLTGSVILTATYAALLFAISEGSLLLAVITRKQMAFIPLIPLVAYAATLAVSYDPVGSVAALIPFPAMLALAWGTRSAAAREDGPTRVGVICATALALGASFAAAVAVAVYRSLGTLDPDTILESMEAFRMALIQRITSAEIPEGLPAETVAELEKMLTFANAQNAVNSMFNLLPALFVVTVNLISAAAQALQHAALRTFGFGDCLTDRVRAYHMSLISCVVFLGAYLIALFENGDASTLTGTVAQNVYMILLPGLALAGMLRIMIGLARKGPRGMGCLFYLFLLIPFLLLFAPFLLAAVEVIGHISASISAAFKDPDDDDPFGGD